MTTPSAQLVGINGMHKIQVNYRVANWPDYVDPLNKGRWVFRPDIASVHLVRTDQTHPWRIDSVAVAGQRVLHGDRLGDQRASRCYLLPSDRGIPGELTALMAEALALVERERLSVTTARSE